jgi:phosphatidylinositol kinase/protein kinase (PI-3  family)
MRSLAKPRKVTIHGTDGQKYAFLGKPKDDLRKDARLMDFNSIINKILNMNSDSRRRQLRMSYMVRADAMTSDSSIPYRYSYLWHCHPQ